MTPEERDRLVRLETQFSDMKEWMKSIAEDVAEIKKATLMGKGAWTFIIRLGGILVLCGGAFAWLWDHLGARPPH